MPVDHSCCPRNDRAVESTVGAQAAGGILLSVASRYRDFPIILETCRECLQDQFDMAGLRSVMNGISQRRIKVVSHELDTPSPFAASLMFKYVASFMYEGDAPLAERHAHALTIDHVRLQNYSVTRRLTRTFGRISD